MWGMYRIFTYLDAGVSGGMHRHYFAFHKMFSHGDKAGRAERPVLNEGGYWQGQPEFFLERIYEGERQRYATRTGEVVRFRVTLRGQPVRNACVALEVLNAYFHDEIEDCTEALRALNDELEERIRTGVHAAPPRAVRIMLTGSPMVFPNWKVPFIIEDLGGLLAVDEFCTSQRYLSDMVSVDEGTMGDMLMAIAGRYVLPCWRFTCSRRCRR